LQPQNKNKKRKQTKPQNLDSLQRERIQVSEITPSEKNTGITSSSDLDKNNKTESESKKNKTKR